MQNLTITVPLKLLPKVLSLNSAIWSLQIQNFVIVFDRATTYDGFDKLSYGINGGDNLLGVFVEHPRLRFPKRDIIN